MVQPEKLWMATKGQSQKNTFIIYFNNFVKASNKIVKQDFSFAIFVPFIRCFLCGMFLSKKKNRKHPANIYNYVDRFQYARMILGIFVSFNWIAARFCDQFPWFCGLFWISLWNFDQYILFYSIFLSSK